MRLILDKARRATLNMAIDEMLMRSAPSLRFYFWEAPSISIGYFQSVEETARLFQCEKKNIPVVRRLTGGGLVLHAQDLTFSLVVGANNPYLPTAVKDSYLKVSEALRLGLMALYPKLDYAQCQDSVSMRIKQRERVCFDQPSCHDLILDGKKVMGASQRRIHGALLHQASLFLKAEPGVLIKAIRSGFEQSWKITFEEKALSKEELCQASEIEEKRYSSKLWAFVSSKPLSSRNTPDSYKEASTASGRN